MACSRAKLPSAHAHFQLGRRWPLLGRDTLLLVAHRVGPLRLFRYTRKTFGDSVTDAAAATTDVDSDDEPAPSSSKSNGFDIDRDFCRANKDSKKRFF